MGAGLGFAVALSSSCIPLDTAFSLNDAWCIFFFSLWLLAPNLSDHIYWNAHSPRVRSLLWYLFGFETCDRIW